MSKLILVTKAILHLVMLAMLSTILIYTLFYLHSIGINSVLIPDRLRIINGSRSEYIGIWLILSCLISYAEAFILLRGIDRFNRWYGKKWLHLSQLCIARVATIVIAIITAIYVACFYITIYRTL